ncbi:long-chain acyl-CoA synthetase [Panacagrimonas perspica]|uniref:Long-chain acyl-CoA synthetase n=1 Tax=Panacagrimonas perspica TaxID=381431 RepID=A0A4R7PB20_9GAMM|nr:AMP-binding protein [Panacagrimonas perspica]TDU30842.1 long-chain acyl-CoA synthetase [Panacagrimonas perspica]THD01653.1 long-chain fatty acid--CoA ligase [Panacagrimonas perspica]
MSDMITPVDMLMKWSRERGDKTWLVQPQGARTLSWNWKQAEAESRKLAGALLAMGLKRGDRVAISGRNTAHWFLVDCACGLAGLVAVGLYPKQSPDAVTFILKHSEAKVLFLGPMMDGAEFIGAVPKDIPTIGFPYADAPTAQQTWDEVVSKGTPVEGYQRPARDDLAALIYTSGTTGNPKGVMITWGNVTFAAEQTLKVMPSQGEERFFSYLPLAHAFERGAVLGLSTYLGAEVHFLENLDKLAEQLPRVGPTRFYGVPLVYGRFQSGVLRKMPQDKLARLTGIPILGGFIRKKILKGLGLHNARYIFSGAAPLPIPVMNWFKQYLKVDLLQGYGMTENSIYATANLPHQNRLGSVGKPMPDSGFKLSEEGEILFKHPGVMAGYYKEPEKTKETFTEDGYLRTGDKGRQDADGYVYITGRVKDIFKTLKGKYVSPAPIEGQLARNVDIDQLCLVGSGLTQPLMLVSLLPGVAKNKPRAQLDKELIADMKIVNENLEAHEQIAKLVVVKEAWTIDNGVMTPTMKVKRNEIEKRYAAIIEKEGAIRSQIAWEE